MITYLVFDVPASSGGALTILNQYYEKALNDKDNKWIFVVSTANLKETGNIKVLKFPWVKKSWIHRLWFDAFYERKIIKKYKNADLISLQNVPLKTTKNHVIYLHTPLPFLYVKYSFLKEFKSWLYNIVTRFRIKKGLTKSTNQIIVQTEWMKKSVIETFKVKEENINVIAPKLNEVVYNYKFKGFENNKIVFFYPAGNIKFKNHKVIIESFKKIENKNNYQVIFTIDKNEKKSKYIKNEIQKYNLPIKLVGRLNYEEVLSMYENSILIFPSYLETFGLPLLEARTIGTPIIASDKPFSKEILYGYDKCIFFNPFDINSLVEIINKGDKLY